MARLSTMLIKERDLIGEFKWWAFSMYVCNVGMYVTVFGKKGLILYGANAWRGKILTNLTNQSSIIKIFPINILHFNKIIYAPLLVIFMDHVRVPYDG